MLKLRPCERGHMFFKHDIDLNLIQLNQSMGLQLRLQILLAQSTGLNKMNEGWFPFSCFSFRVLLLCGFKITLSTLQGHMNISPKCAFPALRSKKRLLWEGLLVGVKMISWWVLNKFIWFFIWNKKNYVLKMFWIYVRIYATGHY